MDIPIRRLHEQAWSEQKPTWRDARPGLIGAALKRALARPSGNWFVLAASREIGGTTPFGRTIGGVEVVAWRTPDGVAHAGPGECPHLGAALCTGRVTGGELVCRWHGLALGPRGFAGWEPFPVHDDGVLVWVRLDAVGAEDPTDAPILPTRPDGAQAIDAVYTGIGRCEPEDVIANRLDPWHGSWFHPYSFVGLRVISEPAPDVVDDPAQDRFLVEVAFKLARGFGVPVLAAFSCPEPRTVVMHIVEGEGVGSVVETHAVPLEPDEHGHPRTAVVEATIAASSRPGFGYALRGAALLRPAMRWAAGRLWRDDLEYAERRYTLRSTGRLPG